MLIKVIQPRLGAGTLAYSPLNLASVASAAEGLDLGHQQLGPTPFSSLRLISVFARNQGGQPAYRMLLFLHGHRRPFLIEGHRIHYGEFPLEPSDTVIKRLRDFVQHLCRRHPDVALDAATYEFLTGKPPLSLERDPLVLATALGETLRRLDELGGNGA
jgi:hypothetical protein